MMEDPVEANKMHGDLCEPLRGSWLHGATDDDKTIHTSSYMDDTSDTGRELYQQAPGFPARRDEGPQRTVLADFDDATINAHAVNAHDACGMSIITP